MNLRVAFGFVTVLILVVLVKQFDSIDPLIPLALTAPISYAPNQCGNETYVDRKLFDASVDRLAIVHNLRHTVHRIRYVGGKRFCTAFPESCLQTYVDENLADEAYTVLFSVECGLVDRGISPEAPGLVVSNSFTYSHAWHNRVQINSFGRRVHVPKIAVAVSYYPGAVQHTLMDEIPRVVYFDSHLPIDVPILIGGGLERVYVDHFKRIGLLRDRDFIFYDSLVTYTADLVFDTAALQRCRKGRIAPGEPLRFSSGDSICPHDHAAGPIWLIRDFLAARPTKTILVITRQDAGSRRLRNHVELIEAIRVAFPEFTVSPFGSAANVSETIDVFSSASVVVGPHGAGLSNMMFMRPKTTVVEIAYDGTNDMRWPDSFFAAYAWKLGVNFGVSLGSGSYNSDIVADVQDTVEVLQKLIR